jgi:hypothetical protein
MLGDRMGKPLFEIRPDLFPYGRITRLEVELWAMHYQDQQKRSR